MIWTKRAHKSAKFQTFDFPREISPNFYFYRLLLLKIYKISARKYRGVIAHLTEAWCNIWRNTNLLFQKWQKVGEICSERSKFAKMCQVYNVWRKKVQRSYLLWNWSFLQNLKKNWLVVWKLTCGIWQILIRTLGSVKIGTLMGSFCPKYKILS